MLKYIFVIVTALMVSTCLMAQSLPLKWGFRAGGQGWDNINAVIPVSNGFVSGGSYSGVITEDTLHPSLTNNNNAWLFAADTLGNILWQTIFGGPAFDNVTSICKTNDGYLISGIFQDSLDWLSKRVYSRAFTGGYSAQTDNGGNPLWLTTHGGPNAKISQVLNSSPDTSHVFFAVAFSDSITIQGNGFTSFGETGFYITQLSPEGTETLPLLIGRGSCLIGDFCSQDSLLYLSGSFSDSLTIGDTILTSMGGEDIFILCINQQGDIKYIKSAGGSGEDRVRAIMPDKWGSVALTGYFEGALLVDNFIVQSNGGRDIFIAVIDSSGSTRWIKNIGGIGNDYGFTLATDNNSNLFVSGNFVHNILIPDEFGNQIDLSASSAFGNAFIAKYTSIGELLASYNLPASSEDFCNKLIVDTLGYITAIGNFYQMLDLSACTGFVDSLKSAGERDIFVLNFKDICDGITIDAGADTMLCPGQSIVLGAIEDFPFYQWLPDGEPNDYIEVNKAGVYTLIARNTNGCLAVDSIVVTGRLAPTVYAGADTLIEPGNSVTLSSGIATNYLSLEWTSAGSGSFGNTTNLCTTYTPSYTDIGIGTAILTLKASNQCGDASDSMAITINQENDGVSVYPNPTQGMLTFVCNEGVSITTATIITQSGVVLQSNLPVNNSVWQYDLSAYPTGTFLFNLITPSTLVVKTINKL